MSRIKTVKIFYEEKGRKELEKVLSEDLVFTEKIDAHRFSFEKRKNSIYFFGKKSNKSLNSIDRAISDLYEPAINYILSINKNIIKENIRYGCYFISPKFFLETKYKRKPKNFLILTDLKIGHDVIINPEKLKNIASELEIESSNIILSGKLNSYLKERILKFIENNESHEILIKEIFPDFKPLLGGETEGIILRSFYKKYTYLQLYSKEVKNEEARINTNRFEFLLLEILYFMKNLNFLEIKLESDNLEMRYLEFISKVFNKYIELNANSIKENNIKRPDFLEKSGQLSIRYFSDKTTLKLIKDETYNYILRVFISAFNSIRKPRGIIDEISVNEFNDMTEKIQKYISKDSVIDFMEFKEYIK